MFQLLGRAVRRGWLFFLAAWLIFLIATWLAAPPWDKVAQDREFAFLPANSPSRVADDMYARAFPDDRTGSNVVLVLHRTESDPRRFDGDLKFIEEVLEPGLRQIAADEGGLAGELTPSEGPLFGDEKPPPPKPKRSIIARIHTPNAPGIGALLVSPDRKALLVEVELTTELLESHNWPTLKRIEDLIGDLRQQGKVPAGLDLAMTGSAVLGRDHTRAQLQSAHATELLTVVLVVGLLVFIYRAPLLALIPLATVVLSVKIAINLLSILAGAGTLTLFAGVDIYITILAYGAGVDYCLFLMARYKEELDRGAAPQEAIVRAVSGVGAALFASAATVMCGIGMMIFARFGKFREAGIAIPLALFLVLCATLTFSAALLRLAGRWAFWPQRRQEGSVGPAAPGRLERAWEKVGERLLRRPATIWLATVAVMAPFAILAVICYNRLSYDMIGSLPGDAPSVVGTRVLEKHFPAGIMGPTTVLLVSPGVDFGSPQGHDLVRRVTDRLRAEKQELGLADIRTLTAPLGITEAAHHSFAGIKLSREVRREAAEQAARAHYITDLGEDSRIGTRLDFILTEGPFTRRSVATLERIEEAVRTALPDDTRQRSKLYVVGVTASVRDLASVMSQDRQRIEVLVLGSVLVILVLLLRRLVVSVYLLLSVLFSYYTTLGVSFAFFWLLDPSGFTGIDWKVAIFLFTILIAVGEDYNIFLMARFDEEERLHGPVRGIPEALARTGPIISSCGIIMAGTFASLLAGSLTEMKQLGFALAFGVLLDTFVVRPILVPAFIILLHSGRLRLPGRLGRGLPAPAEPAQRTTSSS